MTTAAPIAAYAAKVLPREELRAHVDRLWAVLTRAPQPSAGADSHLTLTARYVVPGGRFREMYYWDSYFTMVGLQASGRHDLVADMVENFAGLIDRYGHIPNGTRSYYLGRSQPPYFAVMVELQAAHDGENRTARRESAAARSAERSGFAGARRGLRCQDAEDSRSGGSR